MRTNKDEQSKANKIMQVLCRDPLNLSDINEALEILNSITNCPFNNSACYKIAYGAAKIGQKDKAKEIAGLISDETLKKKCLDEIETLSPATP